MKSHWPILHLSQTSTQISCHCYMSSQTKTISLISLFCLTLHHSQSSLKVIEGTGMLSPFQPSFTTEVNVRPRIWWIFPGGVWLDIAQKLLFWTDSAAIHWCETQQVEDRHDWKQVSSSQLFNHVSMNPYIPHTKCQKRRLKTFVV